jgi:hypothetical protein
MKPSPSTASAAASSSSSSRPPTRENYFAHRQRKLDDQFLALSSSANVSSVSSNLFNGVVVAVDGHTPELSALDIKQLMSEHGGVYRTNVWSPGVTHLICRNLPLAKVLAELRKAHRTVHIVNERWIADCIAQKRLVNCANYSLFRDQARLTHWLADVPPPLAPRGGGEEVVTLRLAEDAALLDACARTSVDVKSTFVLLVDARGLVLAASQLTKAYFSDQVKAGRTCALDAGLVRRVIARTEDGAGVAHRFALQVRSVSNELDAVRVLSASSCLLRTNHVKEDEMETLKRELERAFACDVCMSACEPEMVSSDKPWRTPLAKEEDLALGGWRTETWVSADWAKRLRERTLARGTRANAEVVLTHGQCRTTRRPCAEFDFAVAELEQLVGLREGDWVCAHVFATESVEEEEDKDELDMEEEDSRLSFPRSVNDVDLDTFLELPCDVRRAVVSSLRCTPEEERDERKKSFPESFSQVDKAVLEQLPVDIANQIKEDFRKRARVHRQSIPSGALESFAKMRENIIALFDRSSDHDGALVQCEEFVCNVLFRTKQLREVGMVLQLVKRLCDSCAAYDSMEARVLEKFKEEFGGPLCFT